MENYANNENYKYTQIHILLQPTDNYKPQGTEI